VKRGGDSITKSSTLSSVLSGSSFPWWLDVIGVGCVLAAGIAVMVPALIHGSSFGPFSVLTHDGLLRQHRTGKSNPFGGDLVTQMLPWASLAWKQVHHGFLPLWNPFNASGTPLAFNWQSAAFSLPAVVGYLVPLAVAYTTQVLVTVAIGGTGVYFLARVMRLNVLGCVFAGVVFELSGSFIGWLGWPVASVMSWSGWLFGAALLVVRGRHRARAIVLFAVAAAFAVYAGQPDTLLLMGCFLSVFVVILLVAEAGPGVNRLRRAGDLLVGALAGLALAAPLLLPGVQLLSMSSRDIGGKALLGQHSLALQKLVVVAIPGLNGFPVAWNRSYIGMLAVVMGLVGLILGRRRPQVVAVGAVAIVAGVVCFAPAVSSVLDNLPTIGAVRWTRSTTFLEFAVAVLAGVGMDALTRCSTKQNVLRLAAGAFSLAAVVVALIWALHPNGDPTRHRNLAWAFGGAVLGLIVTGALELVRRRRLRADRLQPDAPHQRLARTGAILALGAGVLLMAYQGAFQLVMGGNQLSSTSHPFHPTAAEQLLAKTVGSSLVGFGSTACVSPPVLGIPVNANIAYGTRELAVYDPVLPKNFYFSWSRFNGSSAGHPATSHYCPAVTSAVVARRYGVSFVLEFRGRHGPKGAIFVKRIGGEGLYRIPSSGEATVVPLPRSGRLPSVDAPGTLVAPTSSNPSSLRIAVHPARPSVLRLRLSDLPGWHASIDGRPLVLQSFEGVMLQAKIPAGAHTIEVHYWPVSFTIGIVLAAISACGLISLGVVGVARRRRARTEGSLST
jgi:hypothetical protein